MHIAPLITLLGVFILHSTSAYAEFHLLHEFNGSDGMDAYNQVLLHEGKLYTTAVRGGRHSKGTLVSLNLESNTLTELHHFTGVDGRSPFNLTAIYDNKIWGVTRSDELNYKGTLFSYDLGDGQTSLVHRFLGAPLEADHPLYGPISVENKLYGLSNKGGSANQGAIYRFDPATEQLDILHSFDSGHGTRPFAGLIWHDGWFVGTASNITLRTANDPPNSSFGVIFKVRADGSDYQVLHRFEGKTQGGHPYGNLVADSDGWLYGTTLGEYYNHDDEGVVFRIDAKSKHYQVLHDFSTQRGDGSKPNGDLVIGADGKTLYGFAHGTLTAPTGPDSPFFGENIEAGTLFQLSTDGDGFRVLHRFDSPENGLVPERTPVLHNGVIYGAAAGGGQHKSKDRPQGMGVLFSYRLATGETKSPQQTTRGSGSMGAFLIALLMLFFILKAPSLTKFENTL